MIAHFGTLPDGRAVHRVRLHNDALEVQVLTLGAIVQDLRLAGVPHPLVLGAPTLAPYLGPMAYFGALVGRFANRIADARFSLDGAEHRLARNCHDRNCLHGGATGSAHKLWEIRDHTPERLTLGLVMPDGEGGFPGQMEVALTLTLAGPALTFDITATTDGATPCSFAQHSFYRLDSGPDTAAHRLRVAAEHYLPVNDVMIPTGAPQPVAGTAFDFRSPRSLRGAAVDHNFCLSSARTELRPVAWLDSTRTGVALELATTEPGLQVFTAHTLPKDGVIGHDGAPLPARAGIALEPQVWPDAPNRPDFPSAILRPGARYAQRTRITLRGPRQ